MSFLDDIKAFEQKALLAANKSVSNVVEELFTSVVVLSPSPTNKGPYAIGLLANQYYPMVGGHSQEVSTATNPYGMASLSRIKSMLASRVFFGKDNFITLTNNVDHAYRAEVMGWEAPQWSGKQGPYSMVSKSVAKIRGMYS